MTLNRLLTTLAGLTLAAGIASAGSITYGPVTFGPVQTDFAHTLNLQKWDPASFVGQTLTGVTINFGVNENVGVVTLTNVASGSETFQLLLASQVSVSGPPDALSPNPLTLSLFNSGFITLGPAGSGPCPAGTPSVACNVVQYNPPNQNATSSVNAAAGNFGFYTGAGTFGLTGQTFTSTTFNGGGNNIQLGIAEVADFTASVTYTYRDSGAPEPATMALFGSALVGLGLFGRKRLAR